MPPKRGNILGPYGPYGNYMFRVNRRVRGPVFQRTAVAAARARAYRRALVGYMNRRRAIRRYGVGMRYRELGMRRRR